MSRQEIAPGVLLDRGDNVVEIASEQATVDAFEHFAEWARQISDEPALLWDRPFNEELERRRNKWLRLFNMREGAGQ